MRLKQMLVLLIMTVLVEYSAPGFTVQAAALAKPGFDEKAVADFYRGKTIRLVVGFSAGGGYDQYSRLIARHLSKYIPGNPTVIVDNMAGAGSIIAANHTFNAAHERRDGDRQHFGPNHFGTAFCQSRSAIRYGQVSLPGGAGERILRDGCYAETRCRKI